MKNFKIIIVEDVPLELKGTEGIIRNDIPEAEIIGTAENEAAYWKLLKANLPDLVLLDLGLGGSSTYLHRRNSERKALGRCVGCRL